MKRDIINTIENVLEQDHIRNAQVLNNLYEKIRKTLKVISETCEDKTVYIVLKIWKEEDYYAPYFPNLRKIIIIDENLKDQILSIIQTAWERIGNQLKRGNKAATLFIALRDSGVIENNQSSFHRESKQDLSLNIERSGMSRAITENRYSKKEVKEIVVAIQNIIKK